MHKFYFILLVLFLGCNSKNSQNPHILIATNFGDIEAELYPKNAPITVYNFLKNIEAGIYKKTNFYRVVKNEDMPIEYNYGIIQGGLWPANKNFTTILHEPTSSTGLSHVSGTISMARAAPGTASTEFFICIGDQLFFDAGKGTNPSDTAGYAAFGKIIAGMRVVRKIQDAKNIGEDFTEKIIIHNITTL